MTRLSVSLPSFRSGLSQLLDVFGCSAFPTPTLPARRMTPVEAAADGFRADAEALASDWRMVGQDLGHAIRTYRAELAAKRPGVE